MKSRSPLALVALSLALAGALSAAAPSNIEFNGVSVEGQVIKVSLLNLITGEARWVPVGGKFGGYVITSCTATSSNPVTVLTSDKGGATQTLRLKDVAIGNAAGSDPGFSRPAGGIITTTNNTGEIQIQDASGAVLISGNTGAAQRGRAAITTTVDVNGNTVTTRAFRGATDVAPTPATPPQPAF